MCCCWFGDERDHVSSLKELRKADRQQLNNLKGLASANSQMNMETDSSPGLPDKKDTHPLSVSLCKVHLRCATVAQFSV